VAQGEERKVCVCVAVLLLSNLFRTSCKAIRMAKTVNECYNYEREQKSSAYAFKTRQIANTSH